MKWEYKTEIIYALNEVDLAPKLNEEGENGWEAVSVEYAQDGYYTVVLKREKDAE